MKFVVINRLIKSGFTNFFRNIWLSVAATSIVTITLFIISTILILYILAGLSINNIKDKVGITTYFNNQATDKQIMDVKAELEAMPQVKSVEFIPKNVARDKFIQAHQNEPLLLQTLNEFKDSENPLPNSFAIKAVDLSDYAQISNFLKSDRFTSLIDRVRDNSVVIDRLFKITDAITKLGLLLTAIFILITLMVMFNTIRLTIYNRREEVEIMRLVGATNWYIRWPFIIEGIMYGLFATFISSLIILGLLLLLSGRLEQFLSLGNLKLYKLFWETVLIDLITGIGLGVISSAIAIRRYLRV